MVDLSAPIDVLVIGGGNAALCAAITARRAGAKVLVRDKRFSRRQQPPHARYPLHASSGNRLRHRTL
jgi:tricarballylate dehydrogenase